MQSQFDRKVNQLREMENGFCNPMKNKVAQELREDLREDLERRASISRTSRKWRASGSHPMTTTEQERERGYLRRNVFWMSLTVDETLSRSDLIPVRVFSRPFAITPVLK